MPKELTETQRETEDDLACYLSMQLSAYLAGAITKKAAKQLEAEIRTAIRRGAESFARELNKLPKNRRQERIDKVASQNS